MVSLYRKYISIHNFHTAIHHDVLLLSTIVFVTSVKEFISPSVMTFVIDNTLLYMKILRIPSTCTGVPGLRPNLFYGSTVLHVKIVITLIWHTRDISVLTFGATKAHLFGPFSL